MTILISNLEQRKITDNQKTYDFVYDTKYSSENPLQLEYTRFGYYDNELGELIGFTQEGQNITFEVNLRKIQFEINDRNIIVIKDGQRIELPLIYDFDELFKPENSVRTLFNQLHTYLRDNIDSPRVLPKDPEKMIRDYSQSILKNIRRIVTYGYGGLRFNRCTQQAKLHCIDNFLEITDLPFIVETYRYPEGTIPLDTSVRNIYTHNTQFSFINSKYRGNILQIRSREGWELFCKTDNYSISPNILTNKEQSILLFHDLNGNQYANKEIIPEVFDLFNILSLFEIQGSMLNDDEFIAFLKSRNLLDRMKELGVVIKQKGQNKLSVSWWVPNALRKYPREPEKMKLVLQEIIPNIVIHKDMAGTKRVPNFMHPEKVRKFKNSTLNPNNTEDAKILLQTEEEIRLFVQRVLDN